MIVCATGDADELAQDSPERRALRDFGYFGHFLHVHAGGRGGKQFILTMLYHRDGHLTQRELLEASSISSAALSEVLSKLDGEGLVTRERSEQDKRQQVVRLTEVGRDRAEQIDQERRSFESACLEVLDEDEKSTLVSTLDRVREHWGKLEGRKAECRRN